jgi:hypothetical protein
VAYLAKFKSIYLSAKSIAPIVALGCGFGDFQVNELLTESLRTGSGRRLRRNVFSFGREHN